MLPHCVLDVSHKAYISSQKLRLSDQWFSLPRLLAGKVMHLINTEVDITCNDDQNSVPNLRNTSRVRPKKLLTTTTTTTTSTTTSVSDEDEPLLVVDDFVSPTIITRTLEEKEHHATEDVVARRRQLTTMMKKPHTRVPNQRNSKTNSQFNKMKMQQRPSNQMRSHNNRNTGLKLFKNPPSVSTTTSRRHDPFELDLPLSYDKTANSPSSSSPPARKNVHSAAAANKAIYNSINKEPFVGFEKMFFDILRKNALPLNIEVVGIFVPRILSRNNDNLFGAKRTVLMHDVEEKCARFLWFVNLVDCADVVLGRVKGKE
jgi:hypothetical protein